MISFSLPRLNGLSPTLESTALKLMEEAGELAQAIGKHRGMNGEQAHEEAAVYAEIGAELLDVMQTGMTMLYQLEEQGKLNLVDAICNHVTKLRERGYLTD